MAAGVWAPLKAWIFSPSLGLRAKLRLWKLHEKMFWLGKETRTRSSTWIVFVALLCERCYLGWGKAKQAAHYCGKWFQMICSAFTEWVQGFPSRSVKTVNMHFLSRTVLGRDWLTYLMVQKAKCIFTKWYLRECVSSNMASRSHATYLIIAVRPNHPKFYEFCFQPYPASLRPCCKFYPWGSWRGNTKHTKYRLEARWASCIMNEWANQRTVVIWVYGLQEFMESRPCTFGGR